LPPVATAEGGSVEVVAEPNGVVAGVAVRLVVGGLVVAERSGLPAATGAGDPPAVATA
jgi:hypothetical protein